MALGDLAGPVEVEPRLEEVLSVPVEVAQAERPMPASGAGELVTPHDRGAPGKLNPA
jgi:hypothetical protein